MLRSMSSLQEPREVSSTIFPIVDPRAADSDIAVQGFSFGKQTTMSNVSVDNVVTTGTSGPFSIG